MSRRRRSIEWAEAILLLIAAGCLGWWVYVNADSFVYQSYSEYQLEQSAHGGEVTWAGYFRHMLSGEHARESQDVYEDLARKTEGPAEPEKEKPFPLGPDGLIGRIEIQRLNVSAIVREGVDNGTLRKAVGHVPGTAFPGQKGNTALAAHRDTFFRGLRDVKEDDVIKVVSPNGTHEYKVASLQIVTPKDVHVLDPTPDPVLTLVTCYPFNYIGHAPKRFIVRANLIPEKFSSRIQATQADTGKSTGKAVATKAKGKPVAVKRKSTVAKARVPTPIIVVSNSEPKADEKADEAMEPEMPRQTILGKLKRAFWLDR